MWSVIIIGLNQSKSLGNCIESVQKACGKLGSKYEIIYIDSDSDDNSLEIALSYKDVKVYLIKPVRRTAGAGRNAGANVSQGENLCFIDADIEMDENFLLTAEKALKEHPEADMVCGQLEERLKNRYTEYFAAWTKRKIGWLDAPVGGGGVIRKKSFEKLRGYDTNLIRGQETELGFRMNNLNMKILGINELFGVHDSGVDTLKKFIRRIKGMAYSYAINFIEKEKALNYKFYEMAKRNFNYSILAIIIFMSFLSLFVFNIIPDSLLIIALLGFIFLFILSSLRKLLFIFEKLFLIWYQSFYVLKLIFHKKNKNHSINIYTIY